MQPLTHQARRPRAPVHLRQGTVVETLQQLDGRSPQPFDGPCDLALNDEARRAGPGFQRKLPGIEIEPQVLADALDGARFVDKEFRRNARLDQSGYRRNDPYAHDAPPQLSGVVSCVPGVAYDSASPSYLWNQCKLTKSANFPVAAHSCESSALDTLFGCARAPAAQAEQSTAYATGPHHHHAEGGKAGEALEVCNAYGVERSCTEYSRSAQPRRAKLLPARAAIPTSLPKWTASLISGYAMRAGKSSAKMPGCIFTSSPAIPSGPATATHQASVSRRWISFASFSAARMVSRSFSHSCNTVASNGGQTFNASVTSANASWKWLNANSFTNPSRGYMALERAPAWAHRRPGREPIAIGTTIQVVTGRRDGHELCTPGWSTDPQINRACCAEAGLCADRAQDGSISLDRKAERFPGTTANLFGVSILVRSLLVTAGETAPQFTNLSAARKGAMSNGRGSGIRFALSCRIAPGKRNAGNGVVTSECITRAQTSSEGASVARSPAGRLAVSGAKPAIRNLSRGRRKPEETLTTLEAAAHRIGWACIGSSACGESLASLLPRETYSSIRTRPVVPAAREAIRTSASLGRGFHVSMRGAA